MGRALLSVLALAILFPPGLASASVLPTAPHPSIAPSSTFAPSTTRQVVAPDYLCNFETLGDDVHYSSTAGDVSGHGWWDNI